MLGNSIDKDAFFLFIVGSMIENNDENKVILTLSRCILNCPQSNTSR